MWKYVLKRIGLALVTTVIILTLTFILMKMLPFQMPVGNDRTKYSYFMTQVSEGLVMTSRRELPKMGDYLWYYSEERIYFMKFQL